MATFTEEFPLIGQVPMQFYLPQSDDYHKLKQLIEKHGGRVTNLHECFTYQVAPLNVNLKQSHYFYGQVYRANWLIDSAKEGKLLAKEDYELFLTEDKYLKKIDFNKKHCLYTLTEAMKVFELGTKNKGSRGSKFWQEVEKDKTIPNRPAESMRNFWKTQLKKGLENYLKKAIDDGSRYCHAFGEIPEVRFVVDNSAIEDKLLEEAAVAGDVHMAEE